MSESITALHPLVAPFVVTGMNGNGSRGKPPQRGTRRGIALGGLGGSVSLSLEKERLLFFLFFNDQDASRGGAHFVSPANPGYFLALTKYTMDQVRPEKHEIRPRDLACVRATRHRERGGAGQRREGTRGRRRIGGVLRGSRENGKASEKLLSP